MEGLRVEELVLDEAATVGWDEEREDEMLGLEMAGLKREAGLVWG